MKLFTLFISFLLLSYITNAQSGTIEGKITESNTGIKIAGVSIKVDGVTSGIASRVDGTFSLVLPAKSNYIITVSAIGYQTKILEGIAVEANKTISLDILMERQTKTEETVIIRSTAKKETTAALIAYQKNTSVVAQVISAEAIRRSPDKNTGEVLKRVPGTSIQDGKYLVVRGLADRYNQAMLNGVLLTSTEPDRKTFSFD
ncbi:MAG: carboxypeptidase-like regulatory domain-containing protein, partial [Ferruginibacter sp.]